MNNINPYSSNTIPPDSLSPQLSNLIVFKRPRLNQEIAQEKLLLLKLVTISQPIFEICRANQEIAQEKPFWLKIIAIAQPIFKILFQIFEFINRCVCFLAKGLISMKTKLTGIDLHIHLFTVVNVQQPCCLHMINRYSENALSV
ncbi:hypothetical protein [Candidatus Protochlamydia amoebophila]|uniref:Uncharacterized protein n=1 Tax=Protochlamydia amoebophila (strain UWE25) TaxID=264201 RepID=Q6MEI2_PARUW|nr:hypothetical protein [Candidatus Protochlamydia amoebophila]CAF23017.1 unnamed protein product [Candidatus Protochlamydia amoebophila UWE25]